MKMHQEKGTFRLGSILNGVFVKRAKKGIGLEVLKQQLAASAGGEALDDGGFACAHATLYHDQHRLFPPCPQS